MCSPTNNAPCSPSASASAIHNRDPSRRLFTCAV
jgi:hypothetical protein